MQSGSGTSSAHTAGPWHFQPSAGDHDYLIYELRTGKDIAIVRNFHEGNARLIAAAPDGYDLALSMRNACEERLSELNSEMSHGRQGAGDDELDDLQVQIDNWSYLLQKCETFLATADGRPT